MSNKTLFIAGTDTGVGKTVVTAGLALAFAQQGLSVCVYKPVQTGSVSEETPEDPEQIHAWLSAIPLRHPVETFCRYNFTAPAAPQAVDTSGNIHIDTLLADVERLQNRYDVLLIEGAGGVRVPIAPGWDTRKLIQALNCPCLVVARPHLGTINHTLLTVESLQQAGIEVPGVVVSGYPNHPTDIALATLPTLFEQWLPVPVLNYLPVFNPSMEGFIQANVQEGFQAIVNGLKKVSLIDSRN